jgi:hypothetical protein
MHVTQASIPGNNVDSVVIYVALLDLKPLAARWPLAFLSEY